MTLRDKPWKLRVSSEENLPNRCCCNISLVRKAPDCRRGRWGVACRGGGGGGDEDGRMCVVCVCCLERDLFILLLKWPPKRGSNSFLSISVTVFERMCQKQKVGQSGSVFDPSIVPPVVSFILVPELVFSISQKHSVHLNHAFCIVCGCPLLCSLCVCCV